MTPRDQCKADMERMRAEGAAFAKRAAYQRKLAIELRKKRDWLGALMADTRASEYRRSRDQYLAEAKKIKVQWGFR